MTGFSAWSATRVLRAGFGRHTPWMGIGRAAQHSRIALPSTLSIAVSRVRMDVAARCWLFGDVGAVCPILIHRQSGLSTASD